jgi:hypothetical protein
MAVVESKAPNFPYGGGEGPGRTKASGSRVPIPNGYCL